MAFWQMIDLVKFLSKVAKTDHSTAYCFALITPDKERTFAVYSKITSEIDHGFINYDAIKNSKMFYTDASNLGCYNKDEVTDRALDLAKINGVDTIFNLNNNYFVEKNREAIIKLLSKIDIIVGGEEEVKNLFNKCSLDEAIQMCIKHSKVAVIPQGAKGATIATKDKVMKFPSVVNPERIVDLNGAGDGFIAGFLFGQSTGHTLEDSAGIGMKTAAQIIYQKGARPKEPLKDLVMDTQASKKVDKATSWRDYIAGRPRDELSCCIS